MINLAERQDKNILNQLTLLSKEKFISLKQLTRILEYFIDNKYKPKFTKKRVLELYHDGLNRKEFNLLISLDELGFSFKPSTELIVESVRRFSVFNEIDPAGIIFLFKLLEKDKAAALEVKKLIDDGEIDFPMIERLLQ